MSAKEIKDLRRLMGKNQEEFAEILGFHKNTVKGKMMNISFG